MQHFPFPACREMDTLQLNPKVNDTKGCMKLQHYSWTMWSSQNLFLENIISLCNKPHAHFPFLYPSDDPKSE